MDLLYILIATYLVILVIFKFLTIKQSIVYLVLWLLSAFNLLGYSGLLELFQSLFPKNEFGLIGSGFSIYFFAFACVTVVHQGFLYHYLHDLEENPEKWNAEYNGFYNSIWDKSIRIFAFLLLLMSVDKIPFVKPLIHSNYSIENVSDKQIITLISSTILFMSLVIYDFVAGVWCKKLKDFEHWIHTGGDLIAFIFWGLITWKVIVIKDQTMGNWAFLPLAIGLIYIIFFIYRVIRSFVKKEIA